MPELGEICKIVCMISPCGSCAVTSIPYGEGTVKSFKKVTPCIGDVFKPYFENFGNKKWLFHEDTILTFKEALIIYQRVGNQLRADLGINLGESVAVCMRNMPEFMLGFLAAASVGCRIVTLNSLWGTSELEYAVKDSDCKLIFCDQQRMDLITPFSQAMGIKLVLCGSKDQAVADNAGAILWDKVVADGQGAPKADTSKVRHQDDCMIMYTSGSTGNPKGVVHSNRSLGTATVMQEMANGIAKDGGMGKVILAVPLFHITAVVNVFINGLTGGQELHTMHKWDAGKAIEIIAKHKITRFTGVPTMVRDMLEHPTFTDEKFASIKQMAGGGAAVPAALMEKVRQKTNGGGVQGYGLTETCGGIILNKGADAEKHPSSTGKAIPLLVEACVKDPETGATVADGERGELCVRTALTMTRYHNKPDETAKALDKQGWFHTGDIAKIEEKFVFILDRLKDLIIRGGENIDCSEVEAKAYSSPKVREVSVFGLPDERLGEVVGMACWPAEKITPEELHEFLKDSGLARFKVPDATNIFMHDEELPKGPTGKIDKKGMRDKYATVVKAR